MAEVSLQAFDARFIWSEPSGEPTAASLTRGQLVLTLQDKVVWGSEEFEWTWVELLEWLSRCWLAINADDGLPFPIQVANAFDLASAVARRAQDSSGNLAEEQEYSLWLFRETHDFARATPGVSMPPFIVWREGLTGHILTNDNHWVVSDWSRVRESLTNLGDQVNARLASSHEPRAVAAVNGWGQREIVSTKDLLEQATGISSDQIPEIVSIFAKRQPQSPFWRDVASNELVAVARRTAELRPETITAVVKEINLAHRGDFVQIEQLARAAVPASELWSDLKPHEQGHRAARAARNFLGVGLSEAFAVDHWLSELGIEYREVALGVVGIDAVAAWGNDHGPVIVINTDGQHSNSTVGRNASVAHEIGHLIFDRHGALPAAEVLGGRGGTYVERRAGAFAAELLLPTAVAGEAFVGRQGSDVMQIVRALGREFGVSLEIVAWQARNSERALDESVRKVLAGLVSVPWQY